MALNQLSGKTLGQYELVKLLGRGGMGVVYQGLQAGLEREVAVKVLTPDLATDPGYLERFTQEAKIAAALEHPNIVTIFDYGAEDDITYVVMRMLTGGTLEDLIKSRKGDPLPIKTVVRLLAPVAKALDYAHSQGVFHRDVKPSNIMFDDQKRPYLVDFGLAKMASNARSLTGSGYILGTPDYMPPEQWRGENAVPATDQYAVAVMAYQMLTGKLPFKAENTYGLMHKHLYELPEDPNAEGDSAISLPITHILMQGLAKDPAERFPSVLSFVKALMKAVKDDPNGARAMAATPQLKPPPIPPTPPSFQATPPGMTIPDTNPGAVTPLIEADALTPPMTAGVEVKKPSRRRLWLVAGIIGLLLLGGFALAALGSNNDEPADAVIAQTDPDDEDPQDEFDLDDLTVAEAESIANQLENIRSLIENRNFLRALTSLNEFIEEYPSIPEAHFGRAWIFREQGFDERALSAVNTTLELDPTYPQAYLLRAEISTEQGNIFDALLDLELYLAFANEDEVAEDLFVWMGELEDRLNEDDLEAIEREKERILAEIGEEF